MGDQGHEQSPLAPSKMPIQPQSAAKCAALPADSVPRGPDLAYLADRWPDLSDHTREQILALARGQIETPPADQQAEGARP